MNRAKGKKHPTSGCSQSATKRPLADPRVKCWTQNTLQNQRLFDSMRHSRSCIKLIIFLISVLVGVHAFTTQEVHGKTLKHAVKEADSPQKFLPFIKEREYTDSPYEIASPEAQRLLDFVEKTMIPNTNDRTASESDWRWERGFISRLRKGEGQYLRISQDVYIVTLGFVMRVANMKASTFNELAWGYDLDIVEKGLLSDGTGWLLCHYGGLSHGQVSSGYKMITYRTFRGETTVQNTELVSETTGYSEDQNKKGSFAYYCGKGEDRIKGIAGEITSYSWKKPDSSGARKIQFTVIERNCDNLKSVNVKKTLRFLISKGVVSPLKGN
ncbi:MAG: hypothetical protein A4E64_01294 [Syntrophorhabdus sp. PtaU1.Bin058]|nr:MAG: hypothetical protein A4E64_01294 [Syntrophorhabdus sp. PtaU1.Bin058]